MAGVGAPGQAESHVIDVPDDLFEQLGHVVVVQFVDDVSAVALAEDETEVAQQAKLMGNGGGLHPDGLRDLGHRRGPRVQSRKDAQPAGSRQRLDALGGCARESRVVEQPVDAGVFAAVGQDRDDS